MTHEKILEIAKEADAWLVSGDELMLFSKERLVKFAQLLEKEIKNDQEYSSSNR